MKTRVSHYRLNKVIRGCAAVSMLAMFQCQMAVQADELWESRLGAWKSLTTINPTHLEGGAYFKQDYAEVKTATVLGKKFKRDQLIPAHPVSKITFTFQFPVTEFRTYMTLREGNGATKGNVTFKISTEEGEVHKSEAITHAKGNHEKVTLKFKPSKVLILETADNGDASEDWGVWLAPEVK